ncbi:hypothetical protein Asp14428_21140 [Actinoplanes sp. NBRC 14428]|nr:hypothetical protein Asp14428_21140 [Actinoplanes sp. NBRC 14428]
MSYESEELAGRLAVELQGVADVEIGRSSDGLTVRVTPRRAGALPIVWSELGDGIVLEAGTLGGRWESVDLAFLRDVVGSVVAGRVTEVFAYRRSRVTVTMPDGSAESETGYDGLAACLPIPLWPRWSRTTRYLPYR